MEITPEPRPKVCYTAAGVLIHEDKILLVKHKKLGIWLNPGGHIEDGELPTEAAEREFWEETGVKVQTFDPDNAWWSNEKGYEHIANPFGTNLHWISEKNYQMRMAGEKVTVKGCEKHLNFLYFVQPVDSVEFKQNLEETTDIAWFTESEVAMAEMRHNIKAEITKAFEILGKFKHV